MTTRPIISSLYTTVALLLLSAPIAFGQWGLGGSRFASDPVKASLIANVEAVAPGSSFLVAVHLKMSPHWHTYWRNAGGEVGGPTTVEWTLPEGFEAGPLQWPTPKRLETPTGEAPIVSYGYEDDVYLLTEIRAAPSLAPGGTVSLAAKVKWLACKDACIPGSANVNLSLPMAVEAPATAHAELFAEARHRLPASDFPWTIRAERLEGQLVLHGQSSDATLQLPQEMYFVPSEAGQISDPEPQALTPTTNGFRLSIPLLKTGYAPSRVSGLLVAAGEGKFGNRQGLAIDVGFEQPKAVSRATTNKPSPATAPAGKPLWLQLIFAFVGGLILNLMPCVLPVLSLKILGFVEQAKEQGSALTHGVVFTVGVLISFWVLGGIIAALKASGNALGWGFQLQSPTFVIALAGLFVAFSLGLFGVMEVGSGLMGVGSQQSAQSGLRGSFFSGVFATLVATPCTAPLMAPALGYAATQPAAISLTIFTMLGLGMAAPVLVLSAFPAWLQFLPKPGPWMESLKQFFGFLLLATAIWLLRVFMVLAGLNATTIAAFGLLSICIGLWVLGRWSTLVASPKTKWAARIICAIFVLAGTGSAILAARHPAPMTAAVATQSADKEDVWRPFNPTVIDELRAQGTPVFVDFTAEWCLSCKVNERVAFRPEVMAAFKEKGVTLFKADFTSEDEQIRKALAVHDRNGVPLYVLYDRQGTAHILPQILTPGIVLKALEKL